MSSSVLPLFFLYISFYLLTNLMFRNITGSRIHLSSIHLPMEAYGQALANTSHGRIGKINPLSFLVGFLFLSLSLGSATVWGASPSGTTRDNLQTAVNSGGTVTYTTGTGTIFSNSSPTINISSPNITIRSSNSSGFGGKIGSLVNNILSQANRSSSAASIENQIYDLTNSFLTTAKNTENSLSYIESAASTGRATGNAGTSYNENKWLSLASTGSSGLSLNDLSFRGVNVVYNNSSIVNGLIGNINTTSTNVSINALTGNAFSNLSVTLNGTVDTQYLAGGGLIGLRSTDASTSISSISGNIFNGVSIITTGPSNGSAYLEGGGLIGVDAVSSPAVKIGRASIDNLANNYFTNITIRSDDILLGGGLVGVNNNSKSPINSLEGSYNPLYTSARLTRASDNVFWGNINVSTGFSIRGGGVIGLNGLSTASVELDALTNNVFGGINVNSNSYIKGGGIVGLQTNDTDDLSKIDPSLIPSYSHADLINASNNLFIDLNVGSGTYIDGGGIIGLRSTIGPSTLNTLNNNVFKGLSVKTGTYLSGGGVVGLSTQSIATLGEVRNNYFDDININVGTNAPSDLTGGGLIGLQSSNGLINVNTNLNISDNTFTNSSINVTGGIAGGGIIGSEGSLISGFGAIEGNSFSNLKVAADHISGGGIIGVHGDIGLTFLDSLKNNSFKNLAINTNQYIEGGGIIGSWADDGIIMEISGTSFIDNRVTAGTYIDGGGIIGVSGRTGGEAYDIERISNSIFSGNTVEAKNGQIMGGLIYIYGLSGGLTITDSSFTNNSFNSAISTPILYSPYAPTPKVYGAVTIDTGRNDVFAPNQPLALTLSATSGNSTVFQNNVINENGTTRTNSLYFGHILAPTTTLGQITVSDDQSKTDATLIVSPKSGGTVALYDPIMVDQNSGYKFSMKVTDLGDFLWGGANIFSTTGTLPPGTNNTVVNTVTLEPGSQTTILTGMSLEAISHAFSLNPGARLNVMGRNVMTLDQADLNGRMHFFLPETSVHKITDIPSDTLLKINLTPSNNTNIEGSNVSLSDLRANSTLLVPGDKFYLLETQGPDRLLGNPSNNQAHSRQGLTIDYNFIIDKEGPNGNFNNQYLVARLKEVSLAKETVALSAGRSASLAFMAQRSSWLPDHSYQSADLALDRLEEGKALAPFVGFDAGWGRQDAGDGRITVTNTTMMLGLAARCLDPESSDLLAAFVEGGYGDYDTHHSFANLPQINGGGTLRYLGGGLMARHEWSNGFRLETSLRAGRLHNSFLAADYVEVNGRPASYKLAAPYYAAHFGLAHTWKIGQQNSLDLLGRYYWTRQAGKNVTLSDGTNVDFSDDDSQRGRVGLRFTREQNQAHSWYAGLAAEHEFDGQSSARTFGYSFEEPDMRGTTGIGEIGWIGRSSKDSPFSVEIGVQGYMGKFRGVSGGIRLGWEF